MSRVTDMSQMFSRASAFNADISKWDVSRVTDMRDMFLGAASFKSDISKWDVSGVTKMSGMFRWATSFNADVSKWDVSSVTNMDYMFWDATSFKRKLCGPAWVHSKATKTVMFSSSSGSIPAAECAAVLGIDNPGVFAPQSNKELENAVDEYLEESPRGTWPDGPYGPMEEWDVSRITDMSELFYDAKAFNADISKWDVSKVESMSMMFLYAQKFTKDISKWDVSRVKNMKGMFQLASSFNGDISKWDVSSVTDMRGMFQHAAAFNCDISQWDVSRVKDMRGMFVLAQAFSQKLCGSAWVHSTADKMFMFQGSSGGSISRTVCTPVPTPPTTRASSAYVVEHVSRRPIPGRELILRASTTANTMTCPNCGTFKKSGRVSCCAPGGAWFKNCGGAGNKNVDHRWSDGMEACKRKFKAEGTPLRLES